ncbi:vegetative cell wall protein gp1-like [Brassica rapa]|uniref:vegetative cell wall protein gp1-like n=1 Tax=Brassica campestris TaxID=3711 RepID=UPI00142E1D69|nr:vegetative cell wall protein gp1-like [Brassica rapa]
MPPRRALFGRRGGPNLPILISSSSDSSPPSTPAPLPTPSFEATPSVSSFETDPSEGSYDQTPVHIPLSPEPYFMNIEVDLVHDSPVHGDHPTAPASPAAHIPPAPAAHIPPAPAAPIPAAQPQPALTDPAIIELLELMAEMVNLQHQALNAQREAQRAQPAPPQPILLCSEDGEVELFGEVDLEVLPNLFHLWPAGPC